MKIATKALKQSHPVGFENTNGRQKGLRKGSNENENSLGLLLLIEQKTVSARATETQRSHVATHSFCCLSIMRPMNMYTGYCF